MGNQEIYVLLAKVLADECTESEKLQIEKWKNDHHANKKLVDFLTEQNKTTEQLPDFTEAAAAWNKFETQLQIASYKTSSWLIKYSLYKFAAAIIITLALLFSFSKWENISNMFSDEFKLITYVVAENNNNIVILEDGTKVILDIGSSLKYPKSFSESQRAVTLNGEAYFEVTSNPSKPFTISANNSQIRVLGTKFNVRSWDTDKLTTVSVNEGKVGFKNKNYKKEVFLTKGLSSFISENNLPEDANYADITKHLGWMEGEIYFEDYTMESIFRHLERKLNVKFILNNQSKAKEKYNLHIKNPDLDNVLKILKALTDLSYTKTEKSIIFN